MDERLDDFAGFAGTRVLAWLKNLGVETASDVRFMWASSHECLSELESVSGITREDILAMQTLFELCCTRSSLHLDCSARRIGAQRASFSAQSRSWTPVVPADPAPKRAKLVIPWRTSAAPVPPLTTADVQAAAADNRTALQRKVRELFFLAVTYFIDLSLLGIAIASWNDEQAVAAAEALVMAAASRCSVGHLTSVAANLRRWVKFAQQQALPISNPSAAHLARFLQQIACGGPTAASSVYHSFRWCNKYLGAVFPLEHFLTLPYKGHQQWSPGQASARTATLLQ